MVDVEKSRYGQTTYTETENLHDLRSQFCVESASTLQELSLKKEEVESEIIALEEEIEALHDLKEQFPDIQFKIEQLRQIKIKDTKKLKSMLRAINKLDLYING